MTSPRLKPVEIRGIIYASQAEAARALGLHRTTIKRAAERGTLQFVGLGSGNNPRSHIKKGQRIAERPITIRGVTYPSQVIAAEILGVKPNTICTARKRGTLDTVGTGERARRKWCGPEGEIK
jgi:hypothetical protein